MGCLLNSRFGSQQTQEDNPECDQDEETSLLSKFKLPSWEKDTDAEQCFGCQVDFNALNRRHHCRRCGNVFCDACTKQRARLLLFAVREPARVCDDCFNQAPRENEFVDRHAPRLRAGAKLERQGLFRATPGTLRTDGALSKLTWEESASGKAEVVQLRHVESVRYEPRRDECVFALVLALDDGGKSEHTFCTSNKQECVAWVQALREAAKHARLPAVAEQVEAERRRKREENAHKKFIQRQFESREKRAAHNQEKRDKLANKYGLRGGW